MHPQISCGRPKTMDVIGSRVTSPKKNPKDHSTMNRRIVLNVAKRSLGGGFLARYDRGEFT